MQDPVVARSSGPEPPVDSKPVAGSASPAGSRASRIANIVATATAIAGAVVASPDVVSKLPGDVVGALRTVVTLGNSAQPVALTVASVLVAAVTHPPKWLARLGHRIGLRGPAPGHSS